MSYKAKGNPFYIVSHLNYNHIKNEWFLYIQSVNAFHSGYNAVPLTKRKHVNLHTGQGTYKMQKYYDK